MHIEDVKQVNGQWLVAGTSGVVLIVVGMGSTMSQAQAQAYSRVKNISIPNMYYRDDIGDRWVEDSDRLHNWGYLRQSLRDAPGGRPPGRTEKPDQEQREAFRERRHGNGRLDVAKDYHPRR